MNTGPTETTPVGAPVVLTIDDDPGSRYAKARILKRAGLNVIEGGTGAEALALVSKHAPALVVLDVKLPDMSGLDVCRRIKSDPATALTLVLQTSATLVGTQDKVRALEGGADAYLAEPMEAEELVASVMALLRLRHVEQALRDSEERFRQLAENIGDVFWVTDLDARQVLYVSPAYESIWGRGIAALQADPMQWLEGVDEQDRERIKRAFDEVAVSGKYDEEYRDLRPDGSLRWVRDRGFPIENHRGVVYRIARISQDISDRKSAEHRLREADRHKDEFLAMLAHELRNPLAPIRNAVQVMRHIGSSDPDLQRAQDMVARQVQHLSRLVDDLLDVSRMTQRKVTLTKQPIDIATAVAEAVETVRPLVDSRRQRLHVLMPDERYAGQCRCGAHCASHRQPAQQRRQVHARSRRKSGSSVERAGADLSFACATTASVSPRRCCRTSSSCSRRPTARWTAPQGGLGIGLSLVKGLVEMHGGSVRASSAGVGQGSEFVVRLPLLEQFHEVPLQAPDARRGNLSNGAF